RSRVLLFLLLVSLAGFVACAGSEPDGDPVMMPPIVSAAPDSGWFSDPRDDSEATDPDSMEPVDRIAASESATEQNENELDESEVFVGEQQASEGDDTHKNEDINKNEAVDRDKVVDEGVIVDDGEVDGFSGVEDDDGGVSGLRQVGELVGLSDRPGAVVGPSEGPLRSHGPSRLAPWETVMGEVYELCHSDLTATLISKMEAAGADPTALGKHWVGHKVSQSYDTYCRTNNRLWYVHITWDGPGPAKPTPEEATLAVQNDSCLYGCGHHLGYGGMELGYQAPHDVFAVETPVDEVIVLWDTIALRDDKLLGLVQNRSAALFAREVTVTLDEHESVFALTLQPGEVAPFELDAETLSALPERSEITVKAILSPDPDLSRAFFGDPINIFNPLGSVDWDVSWVREQIADPNFGANWAPLDPSLDPDDEVLIRLWQITVDLLEPTSHSNNAAVAAGLETLIIEDMRVYLTLLDEQDRVFASRRLSPDNYSFLTDSIQPLKSLPVVDNDGNLHYDFGLDFYWPAGSGYDSGKIVLHIGGAGPWTRPSTETP
ncbi:MAG: hypothetical protein OXD37_09275, partial [Acidimicrobiaceae bacterium]|nr:hypothetical protein [Acidimicrobiaceae bacterium]